MSNSTQVQSQWLKILGKGMVTLPKTWRDDLGLKKGAIVQAKKRDQVITLEVVEPVAQSAQVPYRIYSRKELAQFLRDDQDIL